jgi:hypothetical protein
MAEALNRLGDCTNAFGILKNGVVEVQVIDGAVSFTIPTADNTSYSGIHARGSGKVSKSAEYVIPDYADFVPSSVDPTEVYYIVNDTMYEASLGVVGDTIVYSTTYHSNDEGTYGMQEYTELRSPDRKKDKESPDTLIITRYPKNYLVEKVEDLIVDESALETAFEGKRFYDLMRVAQRRNDPTYLADKVARRKGGAHARNEELFIHLSNMENWFINRK